MQYRSPVDVHLLLTRADRILLARRAGTGYADGMWNLPSGKLDEGEDLQAALIRESREELALVLDPSTLTMATTVHNLLPGTAARIGFFFHPRTWSGEPRNAEPHKCSEIDWFPTTDLPEELVAYSRAGIRQWSRGEAFGLLTSTDSTAPAHR
ncbi:NUDIX domain-containing protein [Nocardia sp. NPDC057227]|uniref:NUDIX hydrolase n=1 Tax=Nocardia sp. NPDC057227 TaxID=3346056 RepID=UPI00363347CF